jgi:tyrosine-protein phosphatase YwqE
MFFNFKSKPKLKELIPKDYVDIHSHLLFGLDDGAKTLEDTLSLVRQMRGLGFSKIITTPHIIQGLYPNTPSTILHRLEEVNIALLHNNIAFSMKAGAEYMMDHFFYENLKNAPLLTLKDNWVLVEMSYLSAPVQLYDIIYELQVMGYQPIMAHPERYLYYFKNLAEYDKLKKSGLYFQLNLLSLVGYYGPEAQSTAEKLLLRGMIDFTGSDIHHQFHLKSFEKKISLKETYLLEAAFEKNNIFAD